MTIFNALFSAWAALAAPERPVEVLADEVTAADGGVDPGEGERRACDDDGHHSRGCCLARCERGDRYPAMSDGLADRGACERRARERCRGRLDEGCFGEPDD